MRNLTIADITNVDADALLIDQYAGTDTYSSLAHKLNIAMILDDAAQARYETIYGRQWVPVPPIGGESDEIVIEIDLSEIDLDRLERAGLATVR